MQTLLSSLLILIAMLYILNQWLPDKLKQRLMQLIGKSQLKKPSDGAACSSCSSCGNCGINSEKNFVQSTKKVMFIRTR